jgi:Tol biopolymer transport system component
MSDVSRARSTAALVVTGLILASALPGHGAEGPNIRRVTVDVAGDDANGRSSDPSISGSGSHLAFASAASDLVPQDTNGFDDIFLRDLVNQQTALVSVNRFGESPNDLSITPVADSAGRNVAFLSWASDLVEGDDNGLADTFVRDMATGRTVLVGPDSPADTFDDEEHGPSISGTGRYVAFVSFSPLVPPDEGEDLDVFVHDRREGDTVRASVALDGGDTNGDSESPSISADGRLLAFVSVASNLVAGDGNGLRDLFVRDLVDGTTVRASVSEDGGDPNGATLIRPALSADGRHVVFATLASNLVGGDANGFKDAYVRHLVPGTTTRVSVDMDGQDPDGESLSVSISQTGRYVAFRSFASDLVVGDTNGLADIYLRDLVARTTTRMSIGFDGSEPDDHAWNPSIDYAGRSVSFVSKASNLVPGDENALQDVFQRRAT